MSQDPLTAAYLAIGAVSKIDGRFQGTLMDLVEGELGLVNHVIQYASAVDAQFDQLQDATDCDYDGVHCYDLAQPLGEWFVATFLDHGILPSKEDVMAKARRLYFQSCPDAPEVP